ncbi:carbohydrate-responsive element-binding protein-like isoform X1 [Heptranchias perlo]|uniref:carbohydrate-responsive element-binding protein-like isoform X1 n=1 Tax=Heptranchias perlo TaxID=212740 RepID=UPI00355AB7B9
MAGWEELQAINSDQFAEGQGYNISEGFFSNHWLLHPQPALPEHSHFCNISSNPFGPGTPRVPAGNVLVDRQPPQADVLSDHGFRLGGALTDATISNDPSETIDSRNVMISRSRFQSPAYYEQRPEYLLPDALPAQQSCMASYSSTMVSAPSATICEQEPSYCSVPLQNPKYRYGPNVSPSVSAHPAPTPLNQHISALTFPPSTVLSPSPSSPLSFTTPSSVQLMAPLQQVPDFPLPKVQSLRSGSRRKYKTLSPELVSPSPLPSPVSAQNSDLTRLLLAGKREAGLSLTHTSVPPSPNSPTSALSEFPGTTLMKAAQQVLRDQPPQSSISYSVPFVIPKTERLSPSSASNGKVPSPSLPGGRHGSAQLSLNNSGEPRSATQPLRSTPSRTRPDSNKLESNWITHISAEQKRRFNIKLGFDTLHRLVTSLDSQPGVKVSKATTLRKTAEYIVKLQQERAQTQEEVQRIREDIEKINAAINICQQQLPATGVPVTRQRFRQMREMFSEYVRVRTLHNWKFWIFSIFIRPLFESFNGMVSTGSVDDLCQTALSWLEQHCSLPALRPGFKMADRLMTYETQFFRFSPQTGVLRVHSGIQDSLLDVMLVVERVILKKLKELPDNSLTPSQVRACTENFLQLMKERFDMIFERVEQGILQHIFYIPENILLPEDNVHEQYPYTEDQCQELQAEIAQLQHCYKSEIIAKHALLAELEDQKMIELKLEQRIHWFNSLDNTWKSNGVSSVPQSLTFVRELAQKIPAVLQKIKEKCKDEVRQSQAVSESEQEEG